MYLKYFRNKDILSMHKMLNIFRFKYKTYFYQPLHRKKIKQ